MTIYTSAALTCQPHNGFCEDGLPRILACLEKHGLKWESIVTMRFILDELGISDCVFSFCKVKRVSEAEAKAVLATYMQFLYRLATLDIDLTDFPDSLKAIRKRCEGHARPVPLANASLVLQTLYKHEPDPATKKRYEALLCLANTELSDDLAACHAGICLMDAGRLSGSGEAVAELLRSELEELLPLEPIYEGQV